MPSIYLKQTEGSYENVNVKEEPYETSNLFKRFKHSFKKPITGDIWIFNKGRSIWSILDFSENYLTIRTKNEHSNDKLNEANVYFNKYDIYDQYPLLLVLSFQNARSEIQNKYYERSKFEGKFSTVGQTENISGLEKYEKEQDILNKLLEENDKLEHILTYNIGIKKGDTPPGNNQYNGNKISVKIDPRSQPTLSSSGFHQYKHEPQGDSMGKNSCVIFKNDLLYGEAKSPINIQNQKYDYISVYYSNDVIEPLLLELCTQSSRPNTNEYYYHKRNDDGSLYWKKIEKKDTVLGINLSGENDVYTQLFSVYSTLYSLLNNLKSHLKKTILFMINNKDIYELTNIQSDFKDWKTYRIINKSIKPEDKTKSESKCLGKYGFKVYEHDFTTSVKGIEGDKEKVELRFLIPKSDDANYNEITLYKTERTSLRNSETLEYKSSGKKLYVYFYGEDLRPLLICYEKNSYKPKKLKDPTKEKQVDVDYTKWTRVASISQCTCMGSVISDNDEYILNAILEVVCFLNPVQLNPFQIPNMASTTIIGSKPNSTTKYDLHKFTPKKSVQMKITRTDISCYDKYSYEPAGPDGDKGDGFRLGTVFYTSVGGDEPKATLDYPNQGQDKYVSLIKISAFYYDKDEKYEEPLLIKLEFKINVGLEIFANRNEYYKLSKVGDILLWDRDPGANHNLYDDLGNHKLVIYLDTIRYLFKSVLQVCIAIKNTESYKANLVDTKSQLVKPEQQINIPVSEETDCKSLKGTGFRCFKHKITDLGSTTLHKIGGLYFVIPNASKTQVKLNLYNNVRTGPISPLYYNCGMGDIYVYFYGGNASGGGQGQYDGDPRPLLLCYNKTSYRAFNLQLYDLQRWYKASYIKNCICKEPDDEFLLRGLVRVSNFLNPVNIIKGASMKKDKKIYTVHKFNGEDISIKVNETSGSGFCYNRYTHIHNGTGSGGNGFRLGNITYNTKWIVEKDSHDKCITSLTNKSPTYNPASEIVVYYYQRDPNHQNPLLVALKNSSGTYKPYYELQRDCIGNRKMYKKGDDTIDLNEGKGNQLETALDRILFYISNSILIDLSFRKTAKQKDGDIPKKQCNTTCEANYNARVYQNIENKPKKTSGNINVNVCGPTDVLIDKKQKTGYMCYCHKITTISDDEQIRGLRLFLWDHRKTGEDNDDNDCKIIKSNHLTKRKCCEIKLINANFVEELEFKHIPYTTCKGDLYVYFYGSDPRPLLLCYNGQAYKPYDLKTYSQKWCQVKTIESCECDVKDFKPEQLLPTLYQISMFLNPVKLSETIEAYTKVIKPVMGDRRKEAKEKGEPVGKWPEHDYTVQTFGNREIKIRVQATDLQCYRPFTSNKDILRYKMVSKLNLIMYYICIYVEIYTVTNNGK